MSFNLDRLELHCLEQISKFASKHASERFYAFAIDAMLLCLNSVEEHEKTVKRYYQNWDRALSHLESWEDLSEQDHLNAEWLLEFNSEHGDLDLNDKDACLQLINEDRASRRREEGTNPYAIPSKIEDLKKSTGDWAYQGFAEMKNKNGFDQQAYELHYKSEAIQQTTSEYGLAMDELVERIVRSNILNELNLTNDFYAIRVEHAY